MALGEPCALQVSVSALECKSKIEKSYLEKSYLEKSPRITWTVLEKSYHFFPFMVDF